MVLHVFLDAWLWCRGCSVWDVVLLVQKVLPGRCEQELAFVELIALPDVVEDDRVVGVLLYVGVVVDLWLVELKP